MMTTIHKQLQQIGLTPNQATIYLALYRLGSAKAGELIKKTGFHRNLVYSALQELADKKLVSASRVRGIALYKALSSTRLLAHVQEQERTAKQVIEELALLTKKKSADQEIIVYEGIDEFRVHELRMYTMVKPGTLIRYLGISPHWHDIIGPSLSQELLDIQISKRIKMRALAKSLSKDDKSFMKQAQGLAEFRSSILVSDNTSGILILDDRISIRSFIEPYFVVEIIHPQLAKNYHNYFDFLWSSSRVGR